MATLLKELRLKSGLSQGALAEAAGTSQPQIRRLENGERRLTKQWAERLAPHLGASPVELIFDTISGDLALAELPKQHLAEQPSAPEVLPLLRRIPDPEFLGKRDLKVFASAECGPGEMMVFSTDPIDVVPRPWFVEREPEAFGVVATGDSMEPVYEAGDITIVSPRAPLVKGKDAIFTAEPIGGDFRASLKRYRGQTSSSWLARQFNPPEGQQAEIEFDRNIWRKALRVVGKFTP